MNPSPQAKPLVLFVCSHNSIRSPMAEALYNAKARRSRAESAGLDPAARTKPLVITVLRERLIDASKHLPRLLNDRMLRSASILVTMGPASAELEARHPRVWDVPLPSDSIDEYRSLRNLLEKQVAALIEEVER